MILIAKLLAMMVLAFYPGQVGIVTYRLEPTQEDECFYEQALWKSTTGTVAEVSGVVCRGTQEWWSLLTKGTTMSEEQWDLLAKPIWEEGRKEINKTTTTLERYRSQMIHRSTSRPASSTASRHTCGAVEAAYRATGVFHLY